MRMCEVLYTHQPQPSQFPHERTRPERELQQNAPASADSLYAGNTGRHEKEHGSSAKIA